MKYSSLAAAPRGRRACLLAAVSIYACCHGSLAGAQTAGDYPARPIRMVVSFGPADAMARIIAKKMEEGLNTPIVVDNKAGAGGLVAAQEVARSKPDGYTVLYTAGSSYTISPTLMPKANVDMARDFIPVSYGHRQAMVLAVNEQLPVRTLGELVAYAKNQPINYASPGAGALPHLMAEMLKQKLGFQATHVPYKSGADMQRALIGAEVQFALDAVSSTIGNVKAGRIRVLAVADKKRISSLADVPTFAESGVTGMEIYSWGALLVPAGTPQAVVNKLHAAVAAAQKDPELITRMTTFNAEPYPSSSKQVMEETAAETAVWARLIRELGLAEK
mgnify:CR=1 FL=1